jgi:hypothetical protein
LNIVIKRFEILRKWFLHIDSGRNFIAIIVENSISNHTKNLDVWRANNNINLQPNNLETNLATMCKANPRTKIRKYKNNTSILFVYSVRSKMACLTKMSRVHEKRLTFSIPE